MHTGDNEVPSISLHLLDVLRVCICTVRLDPQHRASIPPYILLALRFESRQAAFATSVSWVGDAADGRLVEAGYQYTKMGDR